MMLMVRLYELWRKEGREPVEALREAQQWVRDSTNGEKKEYSLSAATVGRMPAQVANALCQEVLLSDPKGRTFAHPYYWAAFSYLGA